MDTQRDAEQTMWKVLENTWESENIEGSSRNFGVKYLKSVLGLSTAHTVFNYPRIYLPRFSLGP